MIDDTEDAPTSTIITLAEAFLALEECSAVSTEDGELFYPDLYPLKDSDENEFAYFEWTTAEGLTFNAKFCEGDNQMVTACENLMTLIDVEGDEITFYLLGPLRIQHYLDMWTKESQ